jgi:hypothetical protein
MWKAVSDVFVPYALFRSGKKTDSARELEIAAEIHALCAAGGNAEDIKRISAHKNIDVWRVREYIRLHKMHPELKKKLLDPRDPFSLWVARLVAREEDPEMQLAFAKRAMEKPGKARKNYLHGVLAKRIAIRR